MNKLPFFVMIACACTGQHPAYVRESAPYADGLQINVLRPEDARRHPAFLIIHGGGWREGRPADMAWLAKSLAEKGYVAATVEYRLSGQAKYPAPLDDVRAAASWLAGQAYSGRVIAVGASAGGHLAAMLGVHHDVYAVVALNPVLDFTDPALSPYARRAVSELLPDTTQWRAASPYHQVTDTLPLLPAPFLVLHGTDDRVVPYTQSVRMVNRLHESLATAFLITAEGDDHGFFHRKKWRSRVVHEIVRFEALLRTYNPYKNND
jgi:acetyl esterase/lipase